MNFINGNWVEGKGKRFSSLNPIDNTCIWEGNFSSNSQMKKAVQSARSAFIEWNKKDLNARLKIIKKFYSLLELNKEKIMKG